MIIATLLRYMDLKKRGDFAWDYRYYIMHDYNLMANKYKFGLAAIMTEYDIENICQHCDGLIVPGSGTNIHPNYYGRELGDEPLPVVDEYSLDSKLMKYFYERNKPIFGICGGHQAINVFLGGTIKKVDDPVAHENGDEKRHVIDIKEGSFVHDVFGKTEAMVNCYHAWEIDDLAPDLDAVARTRDGVIEAIEWKEKNIYATQWHPEQSFHTGDPIENKFFENFLKRCEESR